MQITRTHLAFMEEAAAAFASNSRWETYQDKDAEYIALRFGMDRDCIKIYQLGEEVGFFANVMEKAPQLDILEYCSEVQWFAEEMEKQLKANEHKGGWSDSTGRHLMNELKKNVIKINDGIPNQLDFIKTCANVAKYSMMLADKARGLDL
jgi:hypothetical protein